MITPKRWSVNKIQCLVIYHNYILSYLPKDLLVQVITEQVLSEMSNFDEAALKSTYFKNVILSYKYCGRN